MGNARLVADSLRLLEDLGQLPEPAAEPVLIAISGLPGTGKSFFCRKLAERLPLVLLESDSLRKKLISTPAYSFVESAYLFRVIHLLVERLLARGISVTLDATNLTERNREHLYSIAEHTGARLILVRVEAPPELVRERLKARQNSQENHSDADWEVYRKMQSTAEEIRRKHFTVNTAHDISPVLDKVVREALR